jgi:hypothetical protein
MRWREVAGFYPDDDTGDTFLTAEEVIRSEDLLKLDIRMVGEK